MKIINRGRRSGKTLMMIHTAYVTGCPIIVYNEQRANQILKQATDLGCDVIVYTIDEWVHMHGIERQHPNILIDEAEDFIERALENMLHTKVTACTMSIPCVCEREEE